MNARTLRITAAAAAAAGMEGGGVLYVGVGPGFDDFEDEEVVLGGLAGVVEFTLQAGIAFFHERGLYRGG